MFQDTTNHELNQLMDATRRDEEQITSLREQNTCLLAKVTPNNRDTTDLKVAIRALQSAAKALDDKENRPPPKHRTDITPTSSENLSTIATAGLMGTQGHSATLARTSQTPPTDATRARSSMTGKEDPKETVYIEK